MFGLFGKSKGTIKNPKVLIASVGSVGSSLIAEDREIYESYFSEIETYHADNLSAFYQFLQGRTFDVLHLFASVDSNHTIENESGLRFFEHLSRTNVKLFVLANNNEADNLLPFFSQSKSAGVAPMNLVMTLDRKGKRFSSFFKSVLGHMIEGKTMPQAWVKVAPQNPNIQHETPETIFSAGYGALKFVP